jgi:tRNA (guanine-N7-)-methyltransferase
MIRILTGEYCVWEAPRDRQVELDLGCGAGGFLVQLAARYPARWVVGADVMLGRLRKAEKRCRRAGLANVELLRVSAWPLVACHLPDACLDRVHVLCPDPWPKRRHQGNRLLTSEFLGRLAIKLKPGGLLHLATDDAAYLEFMQAAIRGLPGYAPAPAGVADLWDLQTDFERGFAAARIPVTHLAFARQAALFSGGGLTAPAPRLN